MLQHTSTVNTAVLPNPSAPIAVELSDVFAGGGAFLSRGQILEAAAACLADGGYDAMTIRNIAGRLSCAVGSIYRYFTDKQSLLAACGDQLMRPVLDGLEAGDDFHASVDRYLACADAHAELYQLIFWLPRRSGVDRVPDVIERILAGWSSLLRDGIEARRRWAAIHGQITLGESSVGAAFADAAGLPDDEAREGIDAIDDDEPVIEARLAPADDITLL